MFNLHSYHLKLNTLIKTLEGNTFKNKFFKTNNNTNSDFYFKVDSLVNCL